jgi:hypothetical protein
MYVTRVIDSMVSMKARVSASVLSIPYGLKSIYNRLLASANLHEFEFDM